MAPPSAKSPKSFIFLVFKFSETLCVSPAKTENESRETKTWGQKINQVNQFNRLCVGAENVFQNDAILQ